MKYIIVDYMSMEVPFIFADVVAHITVADRMGGVLVSAGFIDVTDDGEFLPYGRSTTCDIGSREKEDHFILNHQLLKRS